MLLIGFPIDFGKDMGWIPNCHCKVRLPNDFGFTIDLGRTLHGFHIEFDVVRRIIHWFRNVIDMIPHWFWKAFAVVLHWFWKDSGWISIGFEMCLIGFSHDSESIFDGFPITFFREVFVDQIPHWFWYVLVGFSIDSELASDGSPIDFERFGVGLPVDSAKQITWSTHGECCINPSALILIESSLNFNWKQKLMIFEWVPKED